MTKTTTKSSLRTTIISWGIAVAICGGFWLYLGALPVMDPSAMAKPLSEKKQPLKRDQAKMKQDQLQRSLPKEYAMQLTKQADAQAKKYLQDRMRRFVEMAEKIRVLKDELLTKVERRKLPSSAPSDANNTHKARNIAQAGNPPLGANPSVDDLYDMLRQYENEIQKSHLAVTAAKRALSNGLSFPEVYNSLQMGASRMPDFNTLISNQAAGVDWERSEGNGVGGGLVIKSTGDLNNYRGLLEQASRQAGLAESRLEGLFGISKQAGNRPPSPGVNQGGGDGSGDGGMGVNFSNTSSKTPMAAYAGRVLDPEMVKAQAMPGRRFSKTADRKGWLYVNTWYMIGPWESYGRDDYAIIHPPEISIDLDAVYTDGQIGEGIAETDSDPMKIIGDRVKLDGILRWKLMQSESMHNTVPVTTDHSTYYAYTELYFDEAATLLVAIGTDDSGKVWINGKDVWQDSGTSWYHIDEHIAPFTFRQGWNSVLIRLENGGGGATGFNFLITPQK